MAADPMGRIIGAAGTEEAIVHVTFGEVWTCYRANDPKDPEIMNETRAGIPIGSQRRWDLYQDVSISITASA